MTADPTADRRADRRTARQARAAYAAAMAPPVRRGLESALAAIVLPHLGLPGTLGSYPAIGDEIDPAAIEAAAEALGWRLLFPRVTGDAPLSFHEAPYEALMPGYRGLPEPPADTPAHQPDVVLVPLLSVDRAGNRLGQGGGHYDRTLAALRAGGPILAIGLAWDMQLVDHVPRAAWDQPLDAIATPTVFHLAGAGARRAS